MIDPQPAKPFAIERRITPRAMLLLRDKYLAQLKSRFKRPVRNFQLVVERGPFSHSGERCRPNQIVRFVPEERDRHLETGKRTLS